MRAAIRGLGLWLPEDVRHNDAWPASFCEKIAGRHDFTRVDAADDAIGAIARRHSAPYERDPFRGTTRRHVGGLLPSDAESRAGALALEDAGVDPMEVDMVFSHSLVPDRITPPNAPLVAHRLGLRRAAAFGVDAVCASVLAQLVLAAGMIESGRARCVLLVQSHVVSGALDYSHPASVFLGDAASAVVVVGDRRLTPAASSPTSGTIGGSLIRADGALHGGITWERRGGGGRRWHEAGDSFVPGCVDREAVRVMSARLLHFGVETLGEVIGEGVDVLASFQPTAWYVAALAEALGIDAAPCTFDRIAHVGACGVVANLLEARRLGLLRDGARVALYAHGAGVNRATVMTRWST